MPRRQEKIKEGLESRLVSLLVLCGMGRQLANETAKELIGAWMEWLDSQGAVLKVEKKMNGNFVNELFDAVQVFDRKDCEKKIEQAMDKAGAGFFERLIDED